MVCMRRSRWHGAGPLARRPAPPPLPRLRASALTPKVSTTKARYRSGCHAACAFPAVTSKVRTSLAVAAVRSGCSVSGGCGGVNGASIPLSKHHGGEPGAYGVYGGSPGGGGGVGGMGWRCRSAINSSYASLYSDVATAARSRSSTSSCCSSASRVCVCVCVRMREMRERAGLAGMVMCERGSM